MTFLLSDSFGRCHECSAINHFLEKYSSKTCTWTCTSAFVWIIIVRKFHYLVALCDLGLLTSYSFKGPLTMPLVVELSPLTTSCHSLTRIDRSLFVLFFFFLFNFVWFLLYVKCYVAPLMSSSVKDSCFIAHYSQKVPNIRWFSLPCNEKAS